MTRNDTTPQPVYNIHLAPLTYDMDERIYNNKDLVDYVGQALRAVGVKVSAIDCQYHQDRLVAAREVTP